MKRKGDPDPSTSQKAAFPSKLKCLFQQHRYKVLYGGRGGSKSWNVARALLILGSQRRLRILCAREFQNSIADSVHKLLCDQINRLGLQSFYLIHKTAITGINGTSFVFGGLRQNIHNIRSFEGADIVWVEEAHSVSANSWDVLIPTIRKEKSEIWLSFNPDLEEDATYQRFVKYPPRNSAVVMINWRDNPWFPQVLRDEMESLKERDYEAYLHVWEGQCKRRVTGALWTADVIERNRLPMWTDEDARIALRDRMRRIVVAVDPSGCAGKDDVRSDEVGITVQGIDHNGVGYLLQDLSGRFGPEDWAKTAVRAYDNWNADTIIGEKNFGGAMVENTIKSVNREVPVTLVSASRGKAQRAEPIAALYTQDRIRHVGIFPELEYQLRMFSTAGYQGARSPDRADSSVWGFTNLMLDQKKSEGMFALMRRESMALRSGRKKPEPRKPVWAPGSVEYAMEQAEKAAARGDAELAQE